MDPSPGTYDDARARPPSSARPEAQGAPDPRADPYGDPADPYAAAQHPHAGHTGQHPHGVPGHPYAAGPYGPQHGAWVYVPHAARGRSNTAKFWIGAALSVPVSMILAIVAVLAHRSLGEHLARAMVPIGGLLLLVAVIAGLVVARVRWYVLGGLTGAAILTVLLGMVGSVILLTFMSLFAMAAGSVGP